MSLRTLYDEASLWMTPGGYEDGKLFSELPTDGSGDFTFSRGSNLAATRVGPTGLIEKGRENLWLQSTDLGTSPNATTSAANITGGQSGYDGSSNAWELESLSDGFYRRLYQSATQTGVITFSIYAKSANTDSLLIYNNQNGHRAWFDLSNGSLGNLNGAIDSSIEDIGGGWYRCSISLITSTASEFWICPTNGNNVASCDLGNSILLQSAQLEAGLVATDYIETGASTAQAGILEDMPRLDYSGGASCPALLLEPQRRNLVPHSEYIDGLSFASSGTGSHTITANYTLSPEGIQNATRVQMSIGDTNNTGDYRLINTATGMFTGITREISFYAKSLTGSNQELLVYWSYDKQIVTLTSEWQRFEISATSGSTGGVFIGTRGGSTDYFAGGDANLDFAIYGLQIEDDGTGGGSSYATSYIPTYGASVTRSRDLVDNQSLNPVLGDGDLTILYDFNYDVVGREGSGQLFLTFSGSDSLGIKGTQFTNRSLQIFSNGGFGDNITFNNSSPYATRHKVLLRITSDIVELFYNGSKHNDTINTNGIVGSYAWDRIKIDATNAFCAELNQVASFNTALTDSECIALTTL